MNGELNESDLLRSGFIVKGDRLIFIRKIKNKNDSNSNKEEDVNIDYIQLTHLRVIWLVISILIFLLYYGKRIKTADE